MLDPNGRSLYTAALTPPPGFVFDQAVAATYSLDPTTLLTIPVHLAMLSHASHERLLRNPIALLESLRRVTGRLTVYAQRGRLLAPRGAGANVLFGYLEQSIVEVRAPQGGSFHPKLWALRYVDPTGAEPPLLRLLVLSRNLTPDRSWDVCLQLEGRPGVRNIGANRALGELVAALPDLAVGVVPDARRAQAAELAGELRRTDWELPGGFEDYAFQVRGLRGRRERFAPERVRRLAIVSPFCAAETVAAFCDAAEEPVALVSRPETLAALPASLRARFGRCLVFDPAAETDDGESAAEDDGAGEAEDDGAGEAVDARGLHAKVLLAEVLEDRVWTTRLTVGSANATNAAWLRGSNVELSAQLVGRRTRVGGIDDLLGAAGLGELLVHFEAPAEPAAPDPAEEAAQAALEAARDALAGAALEVRCGRTGPDAWLLRLEPPGPLLLGGLAALRAWPVSVPDTNAADALPIAAGAAVSLGTLDTASVTGIVAFELVAAARPRALRFALNLPLRGLSDERDGAVLRLVIRNRESFVRFLLLLLGDGRGDGLPDPAVAGFPGALPGAVGRGSGCGESVAPLLEELTRAYARDPERLRDVSRTLRELRAGADGPSVVPAEFLALWQVFEQALDRQTDGRAR
jgi:hypothetical protein